MIPTTHVTIRALTAALLLTCVPVARGDDPPDAVIQEWSQSWHVAADGAITCRHRTQVQLHSDRVYGEFADPRIPFDANGDVVKVITARVRRPNGSVVDVPGYSKNEVSPGAVAGWPAFASHRELVLTMSGIEPGCVVELEYETHGKPGTRPLSRDLRLADRHPITRRVVELTWDGATPPKTLLTGIGDNGLIQPKNCTELREDRKYRLVLSDVPASPDEPGAPPWQTRVPRLIFGWFADTSSWLAATLSPVRVAGTDSEAIKALAAKWTTGATRDADRLRMLHEKLAATFNFIEPSESVGWLPPRAAGDVLASNYGTPLEALALFAALARASGVTAAEPGIIVNSEYWSDAVPADSCAEAFVLCLGAHPQANDTVASEPGGDGPNSKSPAGMEVWHARHGLLCDPQRWDHRVALVMRANSVRRIPVTPVTHDMPSTIDVDGRISIADNGTFSGTVHLLARGVFVAAGALRGADQQRSRAEAIIRRVLPLAAIAKVNVSSLTATEFGATIELAASPALPMVEGSWRLQLGREGPAEAEASVSINSLTRKQPLRLPAAFAERVKLNVEWPKGWKLQAKPMERSRTDGAWGACEQSVQDMPTGGLEITRTLQFKRRDVPAAEYAALRNALAVARSDAARTILLGK